MTQLFNSQSGKRLIISLLLVAATLVVYEPVKDNDFINFDDDMYVTDNQRVQNGLSWENVVWSFKSFEASNWHPLTWLSHMLDCQLYGLNSTGHHFVSLVFHLINVALLFLVLQMMTGALWRSAFVAALFALHPFNVESVAWVAERKNVLSTMFWFSTMLAYLWYVRKRTLARYTAVFGSLLLGLLAKPMLVTLPFVLLLLDYWPLNRWRQETPASAPHETTDTADEFLPTASASPVKSFWRIWLPLVVEKLPLFALAAGSSIITLVVQGSSGALKGTDFFTVSERVKNALTSYAEYIYMMFWPAKLAVFYPHPGAHISNTRVLLASALLTGISLLTLLFVRRRSYALVGWLWFLGTLVPVIGLLQVGAQAMADRYAYVPLVGLFIVISWGVGDLLDKLPPRQLYRPAAAMSAIIILGTFAVLTRKQVNYWQTNVTLFEHAIKTIPNNYVAHNNLGIAYGEIGLVDMAMSHYQKAIEMSPRFTEAQFNVAVVYMQKGEHRKSLEHFCNVLNYGYNKKIVAKAHNNIGAIMFAQGHHDAAAESFQAALRLVPDFIDAHNNLGVLLYNQGKLEEATVQFNEALSISPEPVIYYRLGKIKQDRGNFLEATEYYQQALKMAPDFKLAQEELDVALGKIQEQKLHN